MAGIFTNLYAFVFIFLHQLTTLPISVFFEKKAGKRNGGLHFKKNVSFLSKESPFFLL